MKIKINDNESYEIRFEEEISIKELKRLVKKIEILSEIITKTSTPKIPKIPKISKPSQSNDEKLKNVKCISCGSQRLHKKGFGKTGLRRLVCKNCKVSFTTTEEGKAMEKQKRKATKWRKNRDEVLIALKTHYFGKREEKLKFAEDKKTSWNNVMKSIHGLRSRFNISPQEVGLQEFPSHKTKGHPIPSQKTETESFKIPTPQPPLELKEEVKEEVREETENSENSNETEKPTGWWKRD